MENKRPISKLVAEKMREALLAQLRAVVSAKEQGDADLAANEAFKLGQMWERIRRSRALGSDDPIARKIFSNLAAARQKAKEVRAADKRSKHEALEVMIGPLLAKGYSNQRIVSYLMGIDPETGKARSPYTSSTTMQYVKEIAKRRRGELRASR